MGRHKKPIEIGITIYHSVLHRLILPTLWTNPLGSFQCFGAHGQMSPLEGKIATKQSYKSANARVRSSRRNLGPPTSRAASGGGNISPWWRKPTMTNVQIGPSYYRPTYTAASQCIGVRKTSELNNQ